MALARIIPIIIIIIIFSFLFLAFTRFEYYNIGKHPISERVGVGLAIHFLILADLSYLAFMFKFPTHCFLHHSCSVSLSL
jgi:hypothetical protein